MSIIFEVVAEYAFLDQIVIVSRFKVHSRRNLEVIPAAALKKGVSKKRMEEKLPLLLSNNKETNGTPDIIIDISKRQEFRRYSNDRIFKIYTLILLFLSSAVLSLWAYKICTFKHFFSHGNKKRNVIFMISDGFGPTSETFARDFYQHVKNGNGELPPWKGGDFPEKLPLDTIIVGQSRTRSANSWITDSAAGATAFSVCDHDLWGDF